MTIVNRTVAGSAIWNQRVLNELTPMQRDVYERIPRRMEYVWDPSFEEEGIEDRLFGRQADTIDVPAWMYFPEVGDHAFENAPKRTTLKPRQEAELFRRYNYARYRLSELIEAQRNRKTLPRARQVIHWYRRAMEARSALVRANMALVLAMIKRTRIPNAEFSELVSEGNMALLRSVEKFDVSRGYKFSTYACRAILKGFNRLATKTGRYRQVFPTEFDPEMERSDYDVRKHEMQRADSLETLREILSRNRARLSDVERTVLMERYAFPSGGKGRTLGEIGKMVGLTNERVRQIQNLALEKVRTALDRDLVST